MPALVSGTQAQFARGPFTEELEEDAKCHEGNADFYTDQPVFRTYHSLMSILAVGYIL